jgi:hypothetical protein
MKLRNGFVSNSSSSSFIISNEKFPTVRDLAKYMLNAKIEDAKYEKHSNSIKYNKKLIKNLNNIDENRSVSFSSCNYDTYIKKVADCYLVSTCNNTQWKLYDYCTVLSDEAKEEIIKIANNSSKKVKNKLLELLEDTGEFYNFGKDYYDLDNEIIGVETYDDCPKCKEKGKYNHMWKTLKHGKICLSCNQVWKRQEKLEKINNLKNEN